MYSVLLKSSLPPNVLNKGISMLFGISLWKMGTLTRTGFQILTGNLIYNLMVIGMTQHIQIYL